MTTTTANKQTEAVPASRTRRRAPRVVIVGAGFGGIEAARAVATAAPSARILVIDRHNFHTFTPLLYQVATAAIEAEEIAYPVRAILRRFRNVSFKVADVTGIDCVGRTVTTDR